jgi:uncharacterized protein (TIGR02271 family)
LILSAYGVDVGGTGRVHTTQGVSMIEQRETQDVLGATAYGSDGDKIGKVGQLFLDDKTGAPEFVTVNTGLFGGNESFIPVDAATLEGDRLVVPFDKATVKDAPNVAADSGHLDAADEERLFEYYGRSTAGDLDGESSKKAGSAARTHTDSGDMGPEGNSARPAGLDTSGPTTDDAMTRSEEHLEVGTRSEQVGRVRLRKYVTTEMETHTVPVRKERAVLETEPVTGGNVDAATGGPEISEEEHEVVLHEERPVVEKTVEPVERVRIGTETTTDEVEVSDEVRKEHIEAEGDVDDRR